MATKTITTTVAKKKMLLARAGKKSLPPIAQMAFGSGGVDSDGQIKEVGEEQTALLNEIIRKDIDKYEIVNDTQISYFCTIPEGELIGEEISELALIDSEGDLVAIKNFMKKGKDSDWEMVFIMNDTM